MLERIQKIIARAGVTSRRAAEELITSGRVRVNGQLVTELGAKANSREDTVEVDGKRLVHTAPVYVALHKPRNVVSTLSDPEGRPSVAELLEGVGTRVVPVGRLDFATSGVLLATNDGDFSQGLLHPKKGVPKTYVVKVTGLMEPADLELWERGVDLEDGRTRPAEVRFLRHEEGKTWFEITIQEGRNQQIRRMGEATGFPVMRLARVSFAGVTHEDLRPGQWRFLTADELMELRKEYGVPKRVRSADTAGRSSRAVGKVQSRGEKRHTRPRDAEARAPRAEGRAPRAEGRAPRAEGRPPRAEGRPPRERDARPPRGEGRPPPQSDARPPRGEKQPARREGNRPGPQGARTRAR